MIIVQNLENAKNKVKQEGKKHTESHTVPRDNVIVNIFLDFHLFILSYMCIFFCGWVHVRYIQYFFFALYYLRFYITILNDYYVIIKHLPSCIFCFFSTFHYYEL